MFASNYDIIFFGIIAFSAIFAFIRGGMVEILSLSVWFIAFWVMNQFGGFMDKFIPASISNQLARSAIVFIVSFVTVAIIITIVKKILANAISAVGLSGLNYLIGVLFGIVRGVLICAILVIVIKMLNFDNHNEWQKSRLASLLEPVVSLIINTLPKKFGELPKPPNINIM